MTSPAKDNPKVFVGICTGPSKDYAMHYMIAALRNLDWDNLEIHWAVTDFGDSASTLYLQRLKQLIATVNWRCPVAIHTTFYDTKKPPLLTRVVEGEVASYDLVLNNLRLLRGKFLDGDADYFLEVGGDNPPPRETVKRLMKYNVDAAFGTCYQRPSRDSTKDSYPLVWTYTWKLTDLDKHDLHPSVKEKLKLAFTCTPFVVPICVMKDWKQQQTTTPYAGGTGMVLIKRHALERVGWHLPPSLYFSEDLYFCHQLNAHGYTTLGDLKFHVPHMDEDGLTY